MFLWNVVIAATLVALRHGHDLADLVAGCFPLVKFFFAFMDITPPTLGASETNSIHCSVRAHGTSRLVMVFRPSMTACVKP